MRGLIVAALSVCACAPAWKQLPHDRPFQAAPAPKLHRIPAQAGLSNWWDKAYNSTFKPLARLVSPARYIAALTRGHPALDVNGFGQVPDSPWFENRITRQAMTPEQVAAGTFDSGGPAEGRLTVVSGKLEGATPGAVVRDSAGTIWFVKFDPPAHPELATGAEVVVSRLLDAAGYWVPQMSIHHVAVARFRIAPDAYRRNKYNSKVKMTVRDLRKLLSNLNPDANGRLRAMFSRAVPGKPIGPFSYRGIRGDDPNDRIPHGRRRSLRGLWVLSAWVNNTDTRRGNTLDTFITVDETKKRGYLRHYLIDFGDALGAAGDRVKYVGEGYEGQIDWAEIGKRYIGFGLFYPYWLAVERSPYRAVGVFESTVFDPARWTPGFPNAAFEQATALDTYWGASIVARFSRELIEAAVAAAQYSNQRAARIITDVLIERRNKVLRYVFESILPLDDPVIENRYELVMTDLEVAAGLLDGATYSWEVRWDRTGRGDQVVARGSGPTPEVDLRAPIRKLLDRDRSAFTDDSFLTVRFRRKRHPAAVEVHLRVAGKRVIPVALEREVD